MSITLKQSINCSQFMYSNRSLLVNLIGWDGFDFNQISALLCKNDVLYNMQFLGQLETCKKKVMQFNEKSRNRIAELVAQNEELAKSASLKHIEEPTDGASTSCDGNQDSNKEEFATKDEKIKKLDEDVNKAVRIIRTKMKEIKKYERALKECEGIYL